MTLKLAQIFTADGVDAPTKASVYLKRFGANVNGFFSLENSIVIDASNFSTLTQGSNKIIIADDVSGFTGNGCMKLLSDLDILDGDESILEYPLVASDGGKYVVWMRVLSTTTAFKSELYLDSNQISLIEETVSVDTWTWVSSNVVISDDELHVLGISLEEKGNVIDKIYITNTNTVPTGSGLAYDDAPFFTVHMRLYRTVNEVPTDYVFAYDYKNSIIHLIKDDWYNFDISILDARKDESFSGMYALVMSSTGSQSDNFMVWELIDTDEYGIEPSAISV